MHRAYLAQRAYCTWKIWEIKVSFNSAGKMGQQNAVVRIYSNASEPIEKVSLISNVIVKSN